MKTMIISMLMLVASTAQAGLNVYLIPGLGVDHRVYEYMEFPEQVKVIKLDWPEVGREKTMGAYAKKLLKQVDQSEPYAFVGLSLGGMVAVEMAHRSKPQFTLIVSSGKTRDELPTRYQWLRVFPFHKFAGCNSLDLSAWMMPTVMPLRDEHIDLYQKMIRDHDPRLFRKHVSMIANWRRKNCRVPVISVHGEKDPIIPMRNKRSVDYIIYGGQHKLLVTHSEKVSRVLEIEINKALKRMGEVVARKPWI